jgi:hypothetical protein
VRGPDWNVYVKNGKLAGECRRLGIRCADAVQRTHDFSVVIDTPHAVSVRLPIFAFPAWGVSVDGKPRPLVSDPATGLSLVQLEPGRQVVAMRWSRMPADITGMRITAAALFVLLGGLATTVWRRRQVRSGGGAKVVARAGQ